MVHLFFLLLWIGCWVNNKMKFYRSGVVFHGVLRDSKHHDAVHGKCVGGYEYWVISDDSMQMLLSEAPGISLVPD